MRPETLSLDEHDLEHSAFSSPFTRDGVTIEIEIYRIAGTQDPWRMEVIDPNGIPTVWHQTFATEQAAFKAFVAMVEADGIASFASRLPGRFHA